MIQPSGLRYLNLFLLSSLLALVAVNIFSSFTSEPAILATAKQVETARLPFSFAQKDDAPFGEPFVRLDKGKLPLRLPDLRNVLMYYGSNHRPDVLELDPIVLVGIRGNPNSIAVMPHTPVYLVYTNQGRQHPTRWSFSPNNAPTSTWIEIAPQENSALITLLMKNEREETVQEPAEFSSFSLNQLHMPVNARSQERWEIGGQRVDGSILHRQKTLWFGKDLFIEQFGGKEFANVQNKERLDFLDPKGPYSCFVGLGDCLAFYDDRWHMIEPGPESRGKPLLVVKKIDERTMGFDLWDKNGKSKLSLELHKSIAPMNPNAKIDIKLVGARSKNDWIAEVGGVRTLLRQDDWLLFHDRKWTKITTTEELDDYINGKLRGLLVVFDGVEKEGNDVGLVGTIFDESRTRQIPIKISLFKSWEKSQSASTSKASKDEDDDDDDDDDLDDDDDDDEDFDDDDDDEDEL